MAAVVHRLITRALAESRDDARDIKVLTSPRRLISSFLLHAPLPLPHPRPPVTRRLQRNSNLIPSNLMQAASARRLMDLRPLQDVARTGS